MLPYSVCVLNCLKQHLPAGLISHRSATECVYAAERRSTEDALNRELRRRVVRSELQKRGPFGQAVWAEEVVGQLEIDTNLVRAYRVGWSAA